MVALRNILRAPAAGATGLTLIAPGVFENEQYVLPENWEFSHDRDDRSHSIEYTVTLVRTGDKHKLKDVPGGPPPINPGRKTKPRGKPQRIFTIKTGVRTLRGVGKAVHKDWHYLVEMNQGQMNSWKKKHPTVKQKDIPTYRWPVGTKFRY